MPLSVYVPALAGRYVHALGSNCACCEPTPGSTKIWKLFFSTQLRAFGDVTGRPLAGTSGRRHLGGHDSWPPLDAAQWIWLAASQSRRPHRAVSSQFAAAFLVGIPIALATQRAHITR